MADTIHVLGEGGGIFELSLPLHETIQDKLTKGLIRRVHADGSPYEVGDHPDVPSLPDSRPPVNAPKAQWVGWAVKNGADVEDAEAFTKQDLIEKYGVEPTPERPVEGGEQPPAENTEGQSEEAGQEQGGEQPPAQ